jgi:tetratricopeptide (TPR) repeat protein
MNLEALKEKARRHEQKEEWKKALDAYREVILHQDKDEPTDLTLYNRVGDIQTRMRQIDGAVKSYERAIDLYLEAELPNNAIAICKKVLRNLPERAVFFLRMGQIRGSQGFLTDAKQNFLIYAERMTAQGNLDAAMDALVELVDLVPEDVEIRLALASQLESHERMEEAVEQYAEAYAHLILQDREDEASSVSEKVRELDPEWILPESDTLRTGAAESTAQQPARRNLGFSRFELGSGIVELEAAPGESETPEAPERPREPLFQGGEEAPREEEAGALEEDAGSAVEGLPTLETDYEEAGEILRTFGMDEADLAEAMPAFGGSVGEVDEVDEEEGELDELPTLSFPDDEEEQAGALPTLPHPHQGAAAVDERGATPMGVENGVADESPEDRERSFEDARFESGVAEGEAAEPGRIGSVPNYEEAADQGDMELALRLIRREIETNPEDVGLYQRRVEYAFRKGDSAELVPAYLDLARCLVRGGSENKARAVFQQVLALSPGQEDALAGLRELDGVPGPAQPAQVASSEEYVDLGSLILGEETEKTTRWQVMAESPSGDDQADFARMLSQFKQKVSEHVDADDVSAHYDLGTAYLEMGLLDEAIGEFQMALRSSPDHLPTHEVMGRCWMEKGQPDMAVRALNRALAARYEVEDELIGIYYIMGRAKEELGRTDEAVEFYEKVFSLDINFQDVTERLRALR